MIEVKAYSGLIRNFRQLSAELGVDIAGMPRTTREKALVAAAYERWGTDAGNHINGQFGVALYDTETEELFCMRDILGAELFFYCEVVDSDNESSAEVSSSEGQHNEDARSDDDTYSAKILLFGTNISDILKSPEYQLGLNEGIIQFYLGFTYVPGEETLFKGIKKLGPGEFLTFCNGELKLGSYWQLSFEPDDSKSLEQWAEELDAAVDASLADLTDSEESIDSFLSGGVDSSFLLAKSKSRKGICAGYANQDISEAHLAAKTAEVLGRGFETVEVTPEEYFATVDEFLLAYEQPQADAAGLSLYCAAKKLVQESAHADVIFSGEGADEFFAGYSNYANAGKTKPWADSVYYGATYIMNSAEQSRFLKHYCMDADTRNWAINRSSAAAGYDSVARMLYTDLRTYFEGSILFNSIRIAKGTGLDIRMPLCDLRVFDIARRMPSRFKVNELGNKLALRKAASKVLPEEVAYRKKLGFPVPIRQWIANPEYNRDIVRAFSSNTAQEFFNIDEIQELLNVLQGTKATKHKWWFYRHQRSLWRYVWTIYIFIRWYELFFEQNLIKENSN